jgi:hypothetical protein
VAAAGATLGALLLVASQVARRSALTLDELHSLALGQLWADGEVLPFSVGSLTRYEGGSWLIAWPVSWLLRLGASGIAAASWTAGSIAVVSVYLSARWLARHASPAAAWLLVPALFAAPELTHYSYRAWGSLAEALLGFPLLALACAAWIARGRPLLLAPLLGALLSAMVLFSYMHMATAVAFVLAQWVEAWPARGSGRLRRAALETAIVGGSALALFAAWIGLFVRWPEEALSIRDGVSLPAAAASFLSPRLDRVLPWFPGAWVGELLDPTPLRRAAGWALAGLSVAAAFLCWRRGGALRWLVLAAGTQLLALGVGTRLLSPPEVYRYYLPLLALSAAMLAAAGPRLALPAAALGLCFWLPSGLPMPYQNPSWTWLALGGNALHRYEPEPHRKFLALRRVAPEWARPFFAFGYGIDSGRRYSAAVSGMRITVAERGLDPLRVDPVALAASDPHFSSYLPRSWVDFWDSAPEATDRPHYLLGLGIGVAADAAVDAAEIDLLRSVAESDRSGILHGIGAALQLAAERSGASGPPALDLRPLISVMSPADWEALGRGAAEVSVLPPPSASAIGLPDGSPQALAWQAGSVAPVQRALRAMTRVPLVPTPQPPPVLGLQTP